VPIAPVFPAFRPAPGHPSCRFSAIGTGFAQSFLSERLGTAALRHRRFVGSGLVFARGIQR
jgi:hypothetical protein